MRIRNRIAGSLVATALVIFANSGASAGGRALDRSTVWRTVSVLGDQPAGPSDVDSFGVRARRGDRIVLRLRRASDGGTTGSASAVLFRGDASGTVLRHRSRRRSLNLRVRVPEDGEYLLRLASPEEESFRGDYEIGLLPAPGTDRGAIYGGACPIVPGTDVEDSPLTGPGDPPSDPPSDPAPEPDPEPPVPPPPPAPVDIGYTLSGAAAAPAIWHVDDALDLYVDGVLVYTDGMNGSGDRAPVRFQAHEGSRVRVVARDWYGLCANLSDLFILPDGGPPILVTNHIDLGCGRPYMPADGGKFFDVTVTL